MQITSALWVDEIRKHEDGRVDLLGLFEDIYLDEVPVTLESLSVFIDLEIAPEDRGRPHAIELRLTDDAGKPVQEPTKIRFSVPTEAEFPRPSAQLDLSLFQITFRRFGSHTLDILVDGAPARSLYLGVHGTRDRDG